MGSVGASSNPTVDNSVRINIQPRDTKKGRLLISNDRNWLRTKPIQLKLKYLSPITQLELNLFPQSTSIVGFLLVILLPLVSCIALSYSMLVQIRNIAVYHDELWNYPAAVAMLQGQSLVSYQEVEIFGYPIPLVSGPYQGAIKSWLIAPILGLLSTSPYTLRGINVFLSFIYLLSLVWTLRFSTPKVVALFIFLLPLLDPNFLLFVPTDQGPFLLQCIFITITLGALLRAFWQENWHYLVLALLMASLTLADKLTTVPFVLAVVPVVIILFWTRLRNLITLKRLPLLLTVAIIPLLPQTIYFLSHGFADLSAMTYVDSMTTPPYSMRLIDNLTTFLGEFFGGTWPVHGFILSAQVPRYHSWFAWIGLVLLLASPLVIIGFRNSAKKSRPFLLFYPVLFLCLLIIFSIFRGLNRPWHYFVLHPVFIVGTFSSAVLVIQLLLKKFKSSLVVWATVIIFTLLLIRGTIIGWNLLSIIETERGVNLTSLTLYEVEEALKSHQAKKIVCLSYSLCYPLYVLSGGQLQIIDSAWDEFSENSLKRFAGWLQEPGTYLVYRHSVLAPSIPLDTINWLNRGSSWLRKQKVPTDVISTIKMVDNRGTEFGIMYLKSN